jgi:hypothetical protein
MVAVAAQPLRIITNWESMLHPEGQTATSIFFDDDGPWEKLTGDQK